MDIQQESLQEFVVGHGGADAQSRPLVAATRAPKAYKGVRVRAATANTIVIYVGPEGVTKDSGYPLPAGEELEVKIENPSKIHVVAEPVGNSQQIVTIAGDIAGETFTLTLDGHTTGPIAVDAAAGTVEDALEVLPNIGAGNVSVSGDAGGPFTVEFTGDLAKTDLPLLVGSDGGINEKQTVAIVVAAAGDKLVLTYSGQSTGELAYDATSAQIATALKGLNNIGDTDVAVVDGDPDGWVVTFQGALQKTDVPAISGVCGKNEKQTVVVTGGAADDRLVLTYDGQSTGELAYDATSAQIAAALKLLNNIGDNDVAVTDGDPAGWVVECIGSLARTDTPAITGVCGKNETQTVVVSGAAAGDKLVLTYDGQSTGELAYDISVADLQTALRALSSINGANVVVVGVAGGWAVEFIGTLAKTDVPAISGVCGKNEKQTVVVSAGAAGDKLVLTYDGQSTGELAYDSTSAQIATALKLLNNIGDTDVAVTDGDPAGWVVEFTGALAKTDVPALTGVCGKNEKQTISLDEGVTGGTFTLTAAAETTGNIAFDATGADIQAALVLLSTIGVGQVSVTGPTGGPWVVEFTGTLGYTDVVALTGDGTNLVGDIKTVTIEETIKGNLAAVGVIETIKGNLATVDVVETVKGNLATVDVTETVKGNLATVNVTETQKGDAGFTVTVMKNDVSVGSKFSWIAC